MTTTTTMDLTHRLGSLLKNGCRVVALAVGEEHGIVLAVNEHETFHPYATWHFNVGDLDATYWGNYHADFGIAVRDFEERTARVRGARFRVPCCSVPSRLEANGATFCANCGEEVA